MLYMLAGRIFLSIDFIEVENPDEGCTSEPEKNENSENFEKINFLGPEAFEFTFSINFFHLFTFAVTRRAGWSHLNSKSNTVAGTF